MTQTANLFVHKLICPFTAKILHNLALHIKEENEEPIVPPYEKHHHGHTLLVRS
jgi:hypothetical protein